MIVDWIRCKKRLKLLALIAGLAAATGISAAYLPGYLAAGRGTEAKQDLAAHVRQKRKLEIDTRFSQGAALLYAQQYDAAATEFHRVLELAPQMPEAHVNMGYSLIGLQRYQIARDFFETAINLRSDQVNAYYGLALALEGLQDLPGALRSYVHLNKQADDGHLPKARAAIWEWEQALAKTPPARNADLKAAGLSRGKDASRSPSPY
jgi:tetratricopeptide (TPR) repeat protein